jgi:hypothetical protein
MKSAPSFEKTVISGDFGGKSALGDKKSPPAGNFLISNCPGTKPAHHQSGARLKSISGKMWGAGLIYYGLKLKVFS